MKTLPASHREVIDCWERLADFADDINVAHGTAKAMRRRNSIPPEYWLSAVEGADRRGIEGVTLRRLASIAAETPRGATAEVAA